LREGRAIGVTRRARDGARGKKIRLTHQAEISSLDSV
jgi:hypothetical protein